MPALNQLFVVIKDQTHRSNTSADVQPLRKEEAKLGKKIGSKDVRLSNTSSSTVGKAEAKPKGAKPLPGDAETGEKIWQKTEFGQSHAAPVKAFARSKTQDGRKVELEPIKPKRKQSTVIPAWPDTSYSCTVESPGRTPKPG